LASWAVWAWLVGCLGWLSVCLKLACVCVWGWLASLASWWLVWAWLASMASWWLLGCLGLAGSYVGWLARLASWLFGQAGSSYLMLSYGGLAGQLALGVTKFRRDIVDTVFHT
jgi:hypothetical protein